MGFIELISNASAKWLANKVPNDKYPTVEDQIEVLTYGFMADWQIVIKGILLVAISYLFGVLISTIIVAISFSSFRVIGGGGYHFESYNKCATASLIQFIGVALIVQQTYQHWSFTNLLYLLSICILIALYIIYRYVPRDTPNKPITEVSEISKFKRWSYIYLIAWTTIMTIFTLLNLKLIVISSCFGLLLELFSISKLGYYGIYEKIDKLT